MKRKCRVLSQVDCGSLIYQTSRIPYITGCTFPLYTNTMHSQTEYRILPTIVQTNQTLGLVLDFYMVNSDFYWHHSVFMPYDEHRTFLKHLSESQAIYLLESEPYEQKNLDITTFFHRLQNGQGFEITDSLRKTIEALYSIASVSQQPSQLLSAPSLS